MDKKEVAALRYRDVVHSVHPVFKGTCVHWRVSGELVEYKKNPTSWRLPLRYGNHVYSEINHHNVDNFHHADACPFSQVPRKKQRFFSPEVAQLPSLQSILPFSEDEKRRKGISLLDSFVKRNRT